MTLYDFEIKKPNGEIVSFEELKGKVVLVVNTATQCGLTPQFKGLEALHQQHKDDGLVVLGFPCNQFAGQEPISNENMVNECELNHGVTFILTEKVEVNGKNAHPLFVYLKKKNGSIIGSRIKWNFTKFLIDSTGKPYKRYGPTTVPKNIEKDIIRLLEK
jgi:glutathione peroxidase